MTDIVKKSVYILRNFFFFSFVDDTFGMEVYKCYKYTV